MQTKHAKKNLDSVAVSLRYRKSLCVWCMVRVPGKGHETHLGV